jgi:hypothetical protein
MRLVAVGLAVVIVAVAVVVLQQGGGGPELPNAIARAAQVTEAEPGGHVVISGAITPSGSTPLRISGRSVYEGAGRSRGFMTIPDPETGGQVKMLMIGDRHALYISSDLLGSLPDGRRWMELSFSSGQAPTSSLPGGGSAEQSLAMLEKAADVEEVGDEEVRGVATTRYRGTMHSSGDQAGRSPLRVETWIDARERILRMRLINSQVGGGGHSAGIDMQMDFLDFAAVPRIEMPDPNEVFDGSNLAETGPTR